MKMKKLVSAISVLMALAILTLALASCKSTPKSYHMVCEEAKASAGMVVGAADLDLKEDGTASIVVYIKGDSGKSYVGTWNGSWSAQDSGLPAVTMEGPIGPDGSNAPGDDDAIKMIRTGTMEVVDVFNNDGKVEVDLRLSISVASMTVSFLFGCEEA